MEDFLLKEIKQYNDRIDRLITVRNKALTQLNEFRLGTYTTNITFDDRLNEFIDRHGLYSQSNEKEFNQFFKEAERPYVEELLDEFRNLKELTEDDNLPDDYEETKAKITQLKQIINSL